MKFHSLCVIIIILFSIYKCSPSTNTSSIYVDLDSDNQVSIFDIFSKINIIPLETNDACLIGNINKLIKYDSTIFILDSKQNIVLAFNHKGKFKYKIQRIGRGPGEYLYAYDFIINKYNHSIELLDCFGKLLIFNLDGTYKMTISLPHPPSAYHKFTLLNQDSILFFTNSNRPNDCLLWLYSRSSGKIIKQFYDSSHSDIVNMLPLFSYNDTTYFSLPLENTIYKVQKAKATPSYTWDFGKYNYHLQHKVIPQEEREKIKFYSMLGNSPQMSYIHILNMQNREYLYCLLSHYKQNKHIFYNKQSKLYHIFTKTKENIDLKTYYMDQNVMIGVELPNSDSYKQLLKTRETNTKNDSLSFISEDANPIIVEFLF